ncbi:uncharacterized protein LOC131239324 isoform X4 [Magnolia sinica]|uniref:uncharacterized protein LOC131239324 isoform X4 n=1 Tax=Magnolia sinica TaxID=86752 RepID=UPI00265B3947|nr:uncharacterized protein LOC131239324 isoform X4 [Magnolia sinica]
MVPTSSSWLLSHSCNRCVAKSETGICLVLLVEAPYVIKLDIFTTNSNMVANLLLILLLSELQLNYNNERSRCSCHMLPGLSKAESPGDGAVFFVVCIGF